MLKFENIFKMIRYLATKESNVVCEYYNKFGEIGLWHFFILGFNKDLIWSLMSIMSHYYSGI